MAIVINGSGTVTGLAVGGLPDGTVDSDTIATGTIVDADVNDLAASKLTGALPAISGASLTGFTDAQMPAGSVLQVVYGTTSSRAATTSTSFVASNLSATITPSSTSSNILIIFTGGGNNNNTDNTGLNYTLYRDSTNMGHSTSGMGFLKGVGVRIEAGIGFTLLDDPTTTSATTYTLYFRSNSGTGSAVETAAQEGAKTGITLMEIAG